MKDTMDVVRNSAPRGRAIQTGMRFLSVALVVAVLTVGCAEAGSDPGIDVSPVTDLSASPGDRQVTLTWIDPGDEDVDSIEITWTPSGSVGVAADPGDEQVIASDLTNGTRYNFSVVVVDSAGNRSAATTTSSTPVAPAAPEVVPSVTSLSAQLESDLDRVELTWDIPEGLEFGDYDVEITWTPGGESGETTDLNGDSFSSSTGTYVLYGMDSDEYTFTVTIVNEDGHESEPVTFTYQMPFREVWSNTIVPEGGDPNDDTNFTYGSAIGESGAIVTVASNGNVYAFDPINGDVDWTFDTGGTPEKFPVVGSDGTVYVVAATDGGDRLLAIDPGTPAQVWAFDTDPDSGSAIRLRSAPVLTSADELVISGLVLDSGGNHLFGLDTADGTVTWSIDEDDMESYTGLDDDSRTRVVGYLSVLSDDTIVVNITGIEEEDYAGYLVGVDGADGSLRWSTEIESRGFAEIDHAPTVAADDTVYVQAGGEILAYAPPSYAESWSRQIGGGDFDSPDTLIAEDGDLLVFHEEYVERLDPSFGFERWYTDLNSTLSRLGGVGEIRGPILGDDGNVYLSDSLTKYVHAVDADTGNVRWSYRVTPSDTFPAGTTSIAAPVVLSGVLFLNGSLGEFHAITIPADGYADSPWPMAGGNPGRTGEPTAIE